MKSVTVSFNTDPRMVTELRAAASADAERSVSSVLRAAVRDYLDRLSQPPAPRRRRESRESIPAA
jgi:hypothetical protein